MGGGTKERSSRSSWVGGVELWRCFVSLVLSSLGSWSRGCEREFGRLTRRSFFPYLLHVPPPRFSPHSAPSPARAPPARIPSPPSVDSLSDDGSYDSSDDDYQLRARSRRPSTNAPAPQQYDAYGSLGDGGGAGLLDTPTGEADPFADDFFAGPE